MQMYRVLTLAAALAALTAVAAGPATEDKAGPHDNTPPPGYHALFDGKDLTGWQGAIPINKRLAMSPTELAAAQKEADEKILPHWKVENGLLVNDGLGYNLATAKDYGDFDLYVSWKIQPRGDSGIYLRGNPQVQIWDSDNLDPAKYKLEARKGSGALWNNANPRDKVPLVKADNPPGEWNRYHIVMKGDKVWVDLNDQRVVDGVALDNYWEKGRPLPEKGPVELQQHYRADGKPGKLWFKNIYIKEL
jgi:hypothetical protein